MVIIHFCDWNYQDRAYKFPKALIPELKKKVEGLTDKNKQSTWDWFFQNAKKTKGVEDAEYFLDYLHPKECVEEWE